MTPEVQQIVSIALQFLLGLLAILASYAGKKVLEYLQKKGLLDEYEYLKKGIETAVRALEQEGLLVEYTGEQKKEMAMIWARKIADDLGIKVSDEILDFLIEEVVQILNTEAGKFAK